ncbi:hypothetical protein CONPUDRAFT_155560 [Coniophora puteana RWD-64-598 SS2]|uniref:Uncharacterized protein n=1 Tax=Coniophora puteana (strain RWD-64-598) TaxID=741705 RepID=A0A5M3MIC3_CONPW|nr:uncharacterized protein CONPUDRAFT_155560 [Coniophora puteana RWD-64-598 SS2]EIW78843.1 hypothetical protein CONPUDRAFT_155560 [Coniophora puteana RWD-64-598 SS2]
MQAAVNITHTSLFTVNDDSTELTGPRVVLDISYCHAGGSKEDRCDLCETKKRYGALKADNDYLKWRITCFENDEATLSRALECVHDEIRTKTQAYDKMEEHFAISQTRVEELEQTEARLTLARDALKNESRKLVRQLQATRSEHAEDKERLKATHEANARLLKEKDALIGQLATENHKLSNCLKDEKLSGAEAREHDAQFIAKLQRTTAKLEAERSQLIEKMARLERELNKEHQAESSQNQNGELLRENRILASQNDVLKESKEDLKRKLNSANENFERLKIMVNDARHQNESLVKENGRMVMKSKAMKHDAEALADELAKTRQELAGYQKRARRINGHSKDIEHLSRRA